MMSGFEIERQLLDEKIILMMLFQPSRYAAAMAVDFT